MKSPDIITLVEVQDNDGPTASNNSDATASYERLIAAIIAAGGPAYEWTDIAPEYNQDGGQPGGNIRVGYLYNPKRVSLSEGTKGGSTEAVAWENGELTLNPGRILDLPQQNTRKPLAAQFEFQGEKVVVIGTHLNSKGGDQPLFGKNQPPYLGSEAERIELATMINEFIKKGQAQNPDLKVIVAGDMNDFEFTPALAALKGGILTNMVEKVPAGERFSYYYQGNSQVLDHVLVTNNLADQTVIDMIHINALYMEEHGRASDHDPILIRTSLKKPADGVVEEDEWEEEITNGEVRITIPEDELFEETSIVVSKDKLTSLMESGKDVVLDYGQLEVNLDPNHVAKLVQETDGAVTFTYDQTADADYVEGSKGKHSETVLVDPFAFEMTDASGDEIELTGYLSFIWDFSEPIDHRHMKTFELDEKGKWKNAPVTSKGSKWTFKVKNTDAFTIVKTK